MNWILKKFEDLSPAELYGALQLRSRVFVVEQNCVYLDTDGKDDKCWHLLGYSQNELVAYTRLVPAGVGFNEPSIGRVITHPEKRKSGFGKMLMQKSIEETLRLFGNQTIRIGAQLYLQSFYESLGFIQASEVYLEDGIPHIEMTLSPK